MSNHLWSDRFCGTDASVGMMAGTPLRLNSMKYHGQMKYATSGSALVAGFATTVPGLVLFAISWAIEPLAGHPLIPSPKRVDDAPDKVKHGKYWSEQIAALLSVSSPEVICPVHIHQNKSLAASEYEQDTVCVHANLF